MNDKKRKIYAFASFAVLLVLLALISVFVWNWLSSFSGDEFKEYILSFGVLGPSVLCGIQFLQVFVALIPGEFIESAAGYAFGPIWGTIICYIGVTLASVLIFFLTRRFGVRLVEVFISREKINELSFLKKERRRDMLIFLLFFIPGTPKDLLTYFVGLTDIKLVNFLLLSLIARIPSVLSSTFGGHLIGEGRYSGAVLLYAAVGMISLLGIFLYNYIIKKRNK